jgi:hypothetical protein
MGPYRGNIGVSVVERGHMGAMLMQYLGMGRIQGGSTVGRPCKWWLGGQAGSGRGSI